MRLDERYARILEYFGQNDPDPKPELHFTDAYQLLVAVMLSAQCTDKRINQTTPALFQRFPSVQDLAQATLSEVYELIKSVSYPNSKAAHLVAAAEKITNDFGGTIPASVSDLMTLPGVGRKTANVVASVLRNAPVIAVDTHVFRVARRLGLSKGKTPGAVENDLERRIPESLRPKAHHWLLLHGRYICTAAKPKCDHCPIANCCLSAARRSSALSPLAPK
ncbi:MAG: endonuclease III [Bacteroidales bacterium]|mgnify:CR=1 FL=1|nr:endonuclease III [Bacteroidales bacterium]